MADKPALQPRAAIGPACAPSPAIFWSGPLRDHRSGALEPGRGARFPPRHEGMARADAAFGAVHRRCAALAPGRARPCPLAGTCPRRRGGAQRLRRPPRQGVVLSERTAATIRGRIEALRGSEEQAGLTPELRDAIVAWLDAAAAAIEQWPLDPFDFSSIAAQLDASATAARASAFPATGRWRAPKDLHELRQRVVDPLSDGVDRAAVAALRPMWTDEAERLRDRLGRCQDLEVLKRLTGLHQPLAHWRSRLTPACAERSTELAQRAARIAVRLFAEKPKAFRHRLERCGSTAR